MNKYIIHGHSKYRISKLANIKKPPKYYGIKANCDNFVKGTKKNKYTIKLNMQLGYIIDNNVNRTRNKV